ncbi:unnamed protein product [Chrysodeixis includens]|uniref:Uncharacterized protein n=2 Tax=Noctuidae TaxID=7100 RepID=A0A9N8KYY4_CHRIL|nr:unnamed protein product [Chrysodeixis includens]
MYAHDKLSDMIAEQCLGEMYPKNKRIEIQESDEPCIIFCVLKKFGIMSGNGVINLEVYRTMLLFQIFGCVLPFVVGLRTQRSSGTLVDFTDPKVQGHLDALVRMAQSCVIKVRATPKDVRAYFTNSSPVSRSGQCFAACMLEQSDVINHGKVNRELLVHLASLVNGKNSRVVRKLNTVSRLCLDSIEGMSDRCQLASTYNDCLNENMIEFAFPLDIAEEAVRKMPFHLIQPK